MCTYTGRIHPSRRSVLLFANNCYKHNERTHAIAVIHLIFLHEVVFGSKLGLGLQTVVPTIVTEIMVPRRNG